MNYDYDESAGNSNLFYVLQYFKVSVNCILNVNINKFKINKGTLKLMLKKYYK